VEVLSGADTYASIRQVPHDAQAANAPRLIAALKRGKEGLFASLESDQPLTHAAILKAGVFRVLVRRLDDFVLIYGAVDWGEELLLSAPYNVQSVTYEDRQRLLQCLPPGLRGYYEAFNGLKRCKLGSVPTLHPPELPMPFGSLLHLDSYRRMKRLKEEKVAPLMEISKGGDLRLWCYLEKKHLLFVDYALTESRPGRRPDIYYVKAHDFANVHVLKDPVNTMDRYFAHVISRTAGEFDFFAG
jgi:hypothetical protein